MGSYSPHYINKELPRLRDNAFTQALEYEAQAYLYMRQGDFGAMAACKRLCNSYLAEAAAIETRLITATHTTKQGT